MFFYTEAELPEGAVIELTFTMPSEITLGESMPVVAVPTFCALLLLRAAGGTGSPCDSTPTSI